MSKVNFKNRTLFHGDNLEFLRAMNSDCIDLIATDPPFNKGRDFHATPDSLAKGASFQDRWSWDNDVHESWLDEINDDWPDVMRTIENSRASYGDDMGAFLCFMAVRLIAMRRVMKPTASIYLHCDPTASSYLKMLMDGIFGRVHFRNQIVWERIKGAGKKSQHQSQGFGRSYDTILCFSKSADFCFNENAVAEPYADLEADFPHQDDKGRYKRRSPFRPPGLGPRPNLCYPYKGIEPPHLSGWTVSRQKLEQLDKEGEIAWVKGRPWRKQRPAAGVVPNNVWYDINPPSQSERIGYPTQKPLALYERIIKASSNSGDWVLDPFCGCATTMVAAEGLKRKWVGIDIWKGAVDVVIKRLADEGFLKTPQASPADLFEKGELYYLMDLPERTDGGVTAAPYLRVKEVVHEPPGEKMTRKEMVDFLIKKQNGIVCFGCDRAFDDSRYLELDHNTPRADGGINHISNRILLCSPCNRLKGHKLTLSGLRAENKKLGYMR